MLVKIMSFNIQHCLNFITREIDFDVMVDAIKKCGADIIGLQEVNNEGESKEYEAQAKILAEKLGFYYYFTEAIRFDGAETNVSKLISAEEMLEILESGTGRIAIGSWNNMDINIGDYDISELKVDGGKITVNNITTPEGTGLLQVTSYGRDDIDITVNGDVDYFRISFTRFNENMNNRIKLPFAFARGSFLWYNVDSKEIGERN